MDRHYNTSNHRKIIIYSLHLEKYFVILYEFNLYRKPIPRGIIPRIIPRRIGGPLNPLGIEFIGPPRPKPRPLKMAERYVVLYFMTPYTPIEIFSHNLFGFLLETNRKYFDLYLLTCHVHRIHPEAFLGN